MVQGYLPSERSAGAQEQSPSCGGPSGLEGTQVVGVRGWRTNRKGGAVSLTPGCWGSIPPNTHRKENTAQQDLPPI